MEAARNQRSEIPIPCVGNKTCPISGTPCPGHCVYADVMASISLGIVVFDFAARQILFCNRSAHDMLSPAVPIAFEQLRGLLLTTTEGRTGDVAQPAPLRIGSRIVGYTVYYADAFAWVFLRDITEKTRLESIAEAVETMNNIGYVFSAVRHEIGNPLNSIKVALGVLEANLNHFSLDTVAEYIHRMASETARIERLLRSLRSFSLYERPELRVVDMDAFLADLSILVEPELSRRGIKLVSTVEPGAAAVCDARALHQVMLNLITNASDALAACSAPVITLGCLRHDALLSVRIQDNGCGIGPEELAQLFKPFHTTKTNGTGLGLVIARKLLAAMAGTISIESTEGEGTMATITLPGCDLPAEAIL